MNDARLYGAVAEELERGLVRKDLWARALIDSDGNEDAAHERYVVLCAELLRDELEGCAAGPEGGPTPDPAVEVVPAAEAMQDTSLEPGSAGESPEAVASEEPPREPAAADAPAPAAPVVAKWTPHKPGLERVTRLTLILGGVALLGALGLAIAGFEGQGLVFGIAGLLLLGLGLSRVSKSNHYRGPID